MLAAGGSLEATLKAKLSGSFEDACLLLLKLPFDGYCEKLKKVTRGFVLDDSGGGGGRCNLFVDFTDSNVILM